MLGSQRFYGELEELTVDHFWQIADAGDQEPRILAHSSRRDTLELGAEDNDGIASLYTALAEEKPASAGHRASAVTDHAHIYFRVSVTRRAAAFLMMQEVEISITVLKRKACHCTTLYPAGSKSGGVRCPPHTPGGAAHASVKICQTCSCRKHTRTAIAYRATLKLPITVIHRSCGSSFQIFGPHTRKLRQPKQVDRTHGTVGTTRQLLEWKLHSDSSNML